ncbi:MAG: hypothetical protein H6R16_1170 [Proteobacteria bacterium]|uniref:Uncharacterized protein n=1 Tax=Dechloromonas aromatica (strain RCB) TaxID=159087 RepID=Q47CD8_DECAR|nr:hypothetical protein [Pseudomonadota bacterium]
MLTLDIDLLIHLGKENPADFESMKFLLIQKAIQSCAKPELAHKLQSAISTLQGDPKGRGATNLRQTIEEMNVDLRLLKYQGSVSGN